MKSKSKRMIQIERKMEITYRWWKEDDSEINPEHAEALEESAQERITAMIKEGYTGGELCDNVRMHDTDPEDGVEYSGWWEVNTKTI